MSWLRRLCVLLVVGHFCVIRCVGAGDEEQVQRLNNIIQLIKGDCVVSAIRSELDNLNDINMRNSEGLTLLMAAAMYNTHGTVISTLVSRGASLSDVWLGNQTPLAMAAGKSLNADVVKKLINLGADCDVRDSDGCTALMVAIRDNPDKNVAIDMMDWGMNLNATDISVRQSVLLFAIMRGEDSIVSALLDRGVLPNQADLDRITPLMEAVRIDSMAMTQKLLDNGADLTLRDDDGHTALWYAVEHNCINMVSFLVMNGADVNAADKFGYTPFVSACCCRHVDESMLDMLVANGVDPDGADSDGYTPLMNVLSVCADGSRVDYLLSRGANVNAVANDGKTPLMLAVSNGASKDVVRKLLNAGANVNAVDSVGKKAADYAKPPFGMDATVFNGLVSE